MTDKAKLNKEYLAECARREKEFEQERQEYTQKLQTVFKAVHKLNVIHVGLYYQSRFNEVQPVVLGKDKKPIVEEPKPYFTSAAVGLFDSDKQKYLQFDISKQKRVDDQLELDRLRSFRLDDQWFCFAYKDQQQSSPAVHVFEARTLSSNNYAASVAAMKLEQKILLIAYSDNLDQTKIQISSCAVHNAVSSAMTNTQPEIKIEANGFTSVQGPLYNCLYEPSDQEIEMRIEEKQVVVTKENFELLKAERPNVKKLPPNQQQFVAFVAEQLKTYPNVVENLVQFKVTKEDFENQIKSDFLDDYLEFWFVNFINPTVEKDPEDEKKLYVSELNMTYSQDMRESWLETQKIILSHARTILDQVVKKSDKTPLSTEFELVKYFMETITLFKQKGVPLPKQKKKDPEYFRQFRKRQENENKLLFEVEKQTLVWPEKAKSSFEHKDLKLQTDPRDIIAPFVDKAATSESLAKAFKLVLDIAQIPSVIVFGETVDGVSDFWNKVCIGQDWANVDVFRCCYLQDFRYFNIDDESLAETHFGVQKEVEKYVKCATLKLSYFSMARTLITETNLEQAIELITNNAVSNIRSKKSCTEQFCFTCSKEERDKIFNNFQNVDDAVSRELGENMRCDSWEVVQGENGRFLVVRFYFEKLGEK
ncbi:Conserved_hypothetical protein [Hexamita inflata]|uniref:Uncharacterized protein n=1 Tax=Hexamita inflata TaxID=28002 RepID=A0AA86NCR6_9EUKA|nr:Conserved hypothetical protein [Hexamita inflata]